MPNWRRAPTAWRAGRWRRIFAKGDTSALLLPGSPDYLALWLGLTRIGAVVALLNTNLTGEALAHCITVAAPTAYHRRAAICPGSERNGAKVWHVWRCLSAT